ASGGVDTSAAQTFTISVIAVNDAPSFTKGADQRLLEGAAPQTVLNWATRMSAGPADETGQALNFILTSDNPALFSVQPSIAANGTLTYAIAPSLSGINHVARVSVRLHDNGGIASGGIDTSAAQVLVISVAPGISIGDLALAEGDSGPTRFAFPVTLAGASDMPVSVSFATADSTAAAPGDYATTTGTLTFAPGVTSMPINIAVTGDLLNEDDETFSVNLTSAVNGTIRKGQGTGLITNDDAVPTLAIADATVIEGNAGTTNMIFTVTLSVLSGKT